MYLYSFVLNLISYQCYTNNAERNLHTSFFKFTAYQLGEQFNVTDYRVKYSKLVRSPSIGIECSNTKLCEALH